MGEPHVPVRTGLGGVTDDPQKIVVEIDLGSLVLSHGEEGEMLADLIVRQAAKEMLAQAAKGTGYRDALSRRVEAIRDAEILAAVRPLVEQAMSESLQPTNSFGQAKGEPVTLAEVIVKKAIAALQVRSDRGRGGTASVLEQFIEQEVHRALKADLAAAFQEGRAAVLAAVRDEAAQVITDTITRLSKGGI